MEFTEKLLLRLTDLVGVEKCYWVKKIVIYSENDSHFVSCSAFNNSKKDLSFQIPNLNQFYKHRTFNKAEGPGKKSKIN